MNETEGVRFVCAANGVPTPMITWKKLDEAVVVLPNGTNPFLTVTTDRQTNSSAIVTSVLEIANVSETDAGSYECVSQNYIGEDRTPSVDATQFYLVVQSKMLPIACTCIHLLANYI